MAYHRVTRAARAALEAAAQVVLSEAQWRHVDDVLAAFVPDFGREQSEASKLTARLSPGPLSFQTSSKSSDRAHGRLAVPFRRLVRLWLEQSVER